MLKPLFYCGLVTFCCVMLPVAHETMETWTTAVNIPTAGFSLILYANHAAHKEMLHYSEE